MLPIELSELSEYNIRMKYNKLVRDGIPEYIKAKGETALYHIADDAEYGEKLKEKLLEECKENMVDESIEEYADLLEVIDDIGVYKNFNTADVESIREKKAREKGIFTKRIILDES